MLKSLKNRIAIVLVIAVYISIFSQNLQTVNSQCLSTHNGIIESTTGGFKFPDGTTQTTAATG